MSTSQVNTTSGSITTIEISMYPLKQDYKPPIQGFIALLNQRAKEDGFKVETQATCTIICGAHEQLFPALQECISQADARFGKAVYVSKIIPNYQAL